MKFVTDLVARAKLLLERARARYAVVDVTMRTFKAFSEDDGGSHAAALTYYTFFSIFPLLLFAGSLIGFLTSGDLELRKRLIETGFDTVPILKDALSPEGLRLVIENRRTLAGTGAVMALYAGSGAIVALGHALNRINGVTDEPSFLVKRLRSLRWLMLLGGAGLVSLGLGTAAGFAPGIFGTLAAVAGGLALSFAIFATAYKSLPGKDLRWSEVMPGALAAAIGFEILKFAGSAYLARGETARNDTFGTFAAAAALLVASYLLAQVTLLCAEVNVVLAERKMTRQSFVATEGGAP